MVAGNVGEAERNRRAVVRAGRPPPARQGCRSPWFAPAGAQRVPLAGHLVSTGAACPRRTLNAVGGRCQPKGALLIPPVWTSPKPPKEKLVSKRTYQPNNRRRH